MKIVNSYVTGVDIWSTDLTTFSDTRKNRLITGIKLRCEGTLKDGSPVEYEVEVTQQERDVLVHVFDNILERFQLENREGGK